MTEIVLKMIALALKVLKVSFFHFPARTTRPHDLSHIPCGDFEVGDLGKALPFPVRIGFPEFKKVYHQIGV